MSAERAITCPSCGGAIAIKAAGYSVTLGCQYCGALLDVAHPDVAIITKYRTALQGLPLPLGARGTLFGTEWEVIGALARNDGDAYWTEFLLFNPYAGYRWLVHSEDEWQFGTMLLDRPVFDEPDVLWCGSRYVIDYDPVSTTTDRVVGEFYWRVQAGDQVIASTYSQNNDTLSAEWTNGEINWTQLVSLSAGNIYAAFGLAPETPLEDGWDDDDDGGSGLGFLGGGDGGFGRYSDLPKMFGFALGTLLLSLVAMIAFGFATASTKGSLNVAVDGPEQTLTIGTLSIARPYQAVTIDARSSSFDNRWIDLDYMLVDRATQRAHTAYGVVERYSGYDSDGSWTEGGYSATIKFSAIPRGSYDVVVDAQAHAWPAPLTASTVSAPPPGTEPGPWDIQQPTSHDSGERIEIHFTASAGGIMWSNLWLEIALLFGLPLIILWWRSD